MVILHGGAPEVYAMPCGDGGTGLAGLPAAAAAAALAGGDLGGTTAVPLGGGGGGGGGGAGEEGLAVFPWMEPPPGGMLPLNVEVCCTHPCPLAQLSVLVEDRHIHQGHMI